MAVARLSLCRHRQGALEEGRSWKHDAISPTQVVTQVVTASVAHLLEKYCDSGYGDLFLRM